MKRVISASKRTDIPAFYLRWLVDQVAEGCVDVPNPLYREKSTHVSLSPGDVAWIVFWSKNYHVFERFAHHFDDYELYFQFTINAPSPFLEPDVPSSEEALRQAEFLSGRYGGRRVAWRYDPLVCWQEGGELRSNYDPRWFALMCGALSALGIERCFTSFADHYPKFVQRARTGFRSVRLVDPATPVKVAWATELRDIATAHGIRLFSCTEPVLEEVLPRGSCIDGQLLNALGSERVSCAQASDVQTPGRAACGCARSVDIGDYQAQECGYSCLYCYANPNHRRFSKRRADGEGPGEVASIRDP